MALYRNNQQAFIRGDINRLRLGAELQIPSADELFALDAGSAQAQFATALRGGRVTAAPLTDVSRPVEPADRLEIAAVPESMPSALPAQRAEGIAEGLEPEPESIERDLLLVQESAESTRQETLELRARIQELETQLGDIERLLELRNEQLAQLQAAGVAVPAEPPEGALSDRSLQPEPPVVEEEAVAEVGEPADTLAAIDEEAAGPAVEEPAVAEEAAEAEAPSQQPEAPEEAAAPEAAVATGEGEMPPKPFWEDIPPSTLALAVGVPVLLLLIGLLAARRRKRVAQEAPPEQAIAAAGEPAAREAPAPRLAPGGGLSAGAREGIDVSSGIAVPPGGLGELDKETEEADIVSEADVYIAYGRYREAESLLSEEIKASPQRVDLKFKLAEAYFGAKNAPAFDGLMTELRGMGAERSDPDQWQRLVLMSNELAGSGPPSVEAADLELSTAARKPAESSFEPAATDWSLGKESSEADEELRLSSFAEEGLDSERLATDRDLDLDTGELGDLVSGVGPAEEKGAGAKEGRLEIPLEDLQEAGLEGFGEPETKRAAPVGAEPLSERASVGPESLGGASLDSLDITPTGKDTAASDVLSSQWQMDSGFWDEVATKIDLARAYMEMEDPEAARVILEEVVAEGTEEQKSEAQEMLSRLD
jgi:pilus assembly protein FimV